MKFGSIRTLVKDKSGNLGVAPFSSSPSVERKTTPKSNEEGVFSAIMRSDPTKPLDPSTNSRVDMEVAGDTTATSIGPEMLFAPMLAEITGESTSNRAGDAKNTSKLLYQMYRDIYASDPICGNAVDMMSEMPFSDFTLVGAKDEKFLRPFEESIDNASIKRLFPVLSTEYSVQGLFCSTTMFDKRDGIYTGIIPQNIEYLTITPVPIFGKDPLITLNLGNALQDLKNGKDERLAEVVKEIPEGIDAQNYQPDPEDVIFITRGNLLKDVTGMSLYRRILPIWLIEKALYRGTLDQAFKRQRSISHMVAGTEDWTPTSAEMQKLAQLLLQADLDPVGAVFVTRDGVSVSDIRDASNFWKVMDSADYFTTGKLRALGISESFLSGDASFNGLDQAMSTYMEQVRAYRDKITYEMFYDRMFIRIAKANNLTNKKHGLNMTLASERDENQLEMFGEATLGNPFEVTGAALSDVRYSYRDLLIPRVSWHKRLRPEADEAYLEMLNTLSEKGIPIPLRMWAAAGGLDLKSLINQRDEDIKLRDTLKDWVTGIAKTTSLIQNGGSAPDEGGGADNSFASYSPDLVTALTHETQGRRSLLDRGSDELMEDYSARNGSRKFITKKGAAVLEERMNKKIAEVAAKLNALENRKDARREARDRDAFSKRKFYTGD